MLRITILLLALSFSACAGNEAASSSTTVQQPPHDETAGPTDVPDEPVDETVEGLVVGTDACETDADCVPAECCHPGACVAAANAPSCDDMMCTQECRYGTLDCGGSCLCHDGHCAARLSEMPAAIRESMPQ